MFPPFKAIPNILEQDYLDYDKEEELVKKSLGL